MGKILMEYALRNRMELLELELQIASNESLIDYEHNGTLPLLSVNYDASVKSTLPTRFWGVGSAAARANSRFLRRFF